MWAEEGPESSGSWKDLAQGEGAGWIAYNSSKVEVSWCKLPGENAGDS